MSIDKKAIEESLNVIDLNAISIKSAVSIIETETAKIQGLLSGGSSGNTLPIPHDFGVIFSKPDKNAFIFTRPLKRNGVSIAYANVNGKIYLLTFNSSGIEKEELCNAAYGGIMIDPLDNKLKLMYHQWHRYVQGYCTTYMQKSTNGIYFADTGVDAFNANGAYKTCGEDRTINKSGSKYKCYIRPFPPSKAKRSIGYMESNNFDNGWSNITEILKPSINDTNEYYMMSVIETTKGSFGLLTVYNAANGGTTELQLAHSFDGKTNWKIIYPNQFIRKPAGQKQMYGNWEIINDWALIYTIEGMQGHDEANLGNYLYSKAYSITLDDLHKYLPNHS